MGHPHWASTLPCLQLHSLNVFRNCCHVDNPLLKSRWLAGSCEGPSLTAPYKYLNLHGSAARPPQQGTNLTAAVHYRCPAQAVSKLAAIFGSPATVLQPLKESVVAAASAQLQLQQRPGCRCLWWQGCACQAACAQHTTAALLVAPTPLQQEGRQMMPLQLCPLVKEPQPAPVKSAGVLVGGLSCLQCQLCCCSCCVPEGHRTVGSNENSVSGTGVTCIACVSWERTTFDSPCTFWLRCCDSHLLVQLSGASLRSLPIPGSPGDVWH